MIFQHWGATPEEVAAPLPGDDLCPDARLVATRAISLAAAPGEVFPWLVQMGFGRAGWYSYDLLDNLGRRSARRIHPEWQSLAEGDLVPGGPIAFRAAVVDPGRAIVLAVTGRKGRIGRIAFTLAYVLQSDNGGTRLVSRVRARADLPGGRLAERLLLGPGDGIMVRRQLLNIEKRTASSDVT